MNFNRRQFLRGLGVCIALPAFESLAPLRAGSVPSLATTATGAPLRTAFLYFPNGAIPSSWWPKGGEKDFQLSPTLQPLQSWQRHIQILGGMEDRSAFSMEDGGGDHARANGTFLTGVRLKKSATDIHAGTSIDQMMARNLAGLTRFPSLELTCETSRLSGICDSGYSCAYQYNLSWSSPTTPAAAEANPRLAFERLFGAGPPGGRIANLRRRSQEQRTILDFVLEDARAMRRRLGANDRNKLDEYLTGVREIDARIQASERLRDPKDPLTPTPPGIPSDYGQHLNLMFDIITLAFQTDSTRVATLLLAHDGSNRSFAEIGVPEGHHDLSHHFGNQEKIRKVAEIDVWYVKQFARFLEKLESIQDSDGHSLLHNSMILYGSGNADGNQHTHVNLPLILAGQGGGALHPGRFVQHQGTPLANLFLGLADRLGMQNLAQFGESTGRLQNI